MGERIASDHPTIHTVRATLAKTATGVRVEIPAAEREHFPVGEVVRVVRDDRQRFVRVGDALGGDELVVSGVYDSPRIARNPGEGENLLGGWCDDLGVDPGGSILLDVIVDDFCYGIRAPGETTYYDVPEPPNERLTSIARQLEDENGG